MTGSPPAVTLRFEELSDEALLSLAERDKECFYALMKRYEKKLSAYMRRTAILNREDAEDILQEVYLKVYRNQKGFNPDLKFSNWVYRITRNEVITMMRKKKSRAGIVSIDDTDHDMDGLKHLLADAGDLQETYLTEERASRIRKALFEISEKYREVLVLRYFEDKSYDEIGDILKIPQGTVATLVNRAKKQVEKIAKRINLME